MKTRIVTDILSPIIYLAKFLQYLNENRKNEVDFVRPDKHQKFLQIDTVILSVCGQTCPNYPK